MTARTNWTQKFRYNHRRKKRISGAKPDYKLKYKDAEAYTLDAARIKALNKIWEWMQTQPITDSQRETMEEYYMLKKKWEAERTGKNG